MKNNNKTMTTPKTRKVVRDGLRTQIREEIVVDQGSFPGTNTLRAILPANSTVSNGSAVFSPLGLTAAVTVSGTPNTFVAGVKGNIDPPHLRKLYNLAIDFKAYRVLGGKLIFTPNVGSTTTGQIIMMSSRDLTDINVAPQVAYATGPSYRFFNLSQVSKEISIPLDVDSSWKKVSSLLTIPGGSAGFGGSATAGALVPINSVADLSFGAIAFTIVNPSMSSVEVTYGTFSLVYDVEFKGMVDSAVNG